jgi:hypothetical protein
MGPPDCTVLCQIDNFSSFPTEFTPLVFDKLRELMLVPVLTKLVFDTKNILIALQMRRSISLDDNVEWFRCRCCIKYGRSANWS